MGLISYPHKLNIKLQKLVRLKLIKIDKLKKKISKKINLMLKIIKTSDFF